MSEHKNFVKMTVSGTPGTGTITLGSAVSGFQSFASAYGANATVDVSIVDGTAWEVARDCTYTNSGTTLTRGTLEASSTGSALSLTSAAVVTVTATADFGRRMESAALNHVAGADSNTTMAVSNLYVVDGSTLTADRTYTLPATAAVGDRIGVMMSAGSSTYEVLLTAASGDTLNAVAGGTEWSRLFITGEVVIMRCITANATWMVEHDGRIPAKCFARLSTSASAESAATDTYPTDKGGAWTSVLNLGSIFDASTGTVTNRRACKANVLFSGVSVNSITDGNYFQVGLYIGGALALGPFLRSAATAGVIVQGSVQSYDFPVNTATRYYYASGQGTRGLRGTGDISSSFGFQEVL